MAVENPVTRRCVQSTAQTRLVHTVPDIVRLSKRRRVLEYATVECQCHCCHIRNSRHENVVVDVHRTGRMSESSRARVTIRTTAAPRPEKAIVRVVGRAVVLNRHDTLPLTPRHGYARCSLVPAVVAIGPQRNNAPNKRRCISSNGRYARNSVTNTLQRGPPLGFGLVIMFPGHLTVRPGGGLPGGELQRAAVDLVGLTERNVSGATRRIRALFR